MTNNTFFLIILSQQRKRSSLLLISLFFIALNFLFISFAYAKDTNFNIPEPQTFISTSIDSKQKPSTIASKTWEGTDNSTQVENMRVYKKNNFRIFYFTSGEDKVNPLDADNNKVPDYVEDVVKQMWTTQYVFCNILKFKNPLKTNYYNGINFIDIFIVSPEKLRGATGTTFTEPVQAILRPKGEKAIKILLSKGFRFSLSTTITHEYFHIIQNAHTSIKNLWYLEGLARWSEDVLNKKDYKRHPNWDYYKLLKNKDILNHIHSLSYDGGKFFWIPLTIQLTKEDSYSIDKNDPVLRIKYSDGTPVIQDRKFYGAQFVKNFLEELSKMDKKILEKHNIKWNELTTHHIRNNPYIMRAIELAIKETNSNKQETLLLSDSE